MRPKPVLTKADFVRRYAAGEFGNAAPTWNTFEEWYQAAPWRVLGYNQLYHIRNRIAGGLTWYNVRRACLPIQWVDSTALCGEQNLYISAMAPTELTILQGEVQDGIWGLELTYTKIKKPMRDALAERTQHTRGLMATLLLASLMDDLSWQWLQTLLCRYPDHVIEFSTYAKCWGTIPGYNTVFWEVRKGY